jgi:hypothetical protein
VIEGEIPLRDRMSCPKAIVQRDTGLALPFGFALLLMRYAAE